jgi:hypothetical protein
MYTICQMLHHPLQKDASLTDLRSLHPGRVNQGYIHWMRRISGLFEGPFRSSTGISQMIGLFGACNKSI